MDIQSGYYETGIVLFWLLFAYLFMDKFLFRGELGEICFGKMRRRMAKGLRSIAGWFDPTKEEPKKGRRRTKGKTEKKEVPAVAVPEAEERNHPTVKVEMKGKKKDEVKEKTKGKNMENLPQKRPETDSLVVTKSYGTRQQPPINDFEITDTSRMLFLRFICSRIDKKTVIRITIQTFFYPNSFLSE